MPTLHHAIHKTHHQFATKMFSLGSVKEHKLLDEPRYHLLNLYSNDLDQHLHLNARVSLQQIIRELEATQEAVWSPMILNGSGFGFVANHSLVMANYISRANAALIELSELLAQG
jgi:hypothetical protein